jgi:hypothetical protein
MPSALLLRNDYGRERAWEQRLQRHGHVDDASFGRGDPGAVRAGRKQTKDATVSQERGRRDLLRATRARPFKRGLEKPPSYAIALVAIRNRNCEFNPLVAGGFHAQVTNDVIGGSSRQGNRDETFVVHVIRRAERASVVVADPSGKP